MWAELAGGFAAAPAVAGNRVVVGTLDNLYTAIARDAAGADTATEPFDLVEALRASAATLPANFAGLFTSVLLYFRVFCFSAPAPVTAPVSVGV